MEKIKGMAIELDLDHLSVDRGLKGLKDNIRTVNSEMKRNMSAFDYGEKSVKKYETSLEGLNRKLEVQKRAVIEAKKEYEEMVERHGQGSKEAEKAAREYNNQAASLNNLERYIERTKNELAEFEKQQRIADSSWTKLGNQLESASDKFKSISETTGKVGQSLTNKITKPALVAGGAVTGLVGALGWKRLVGLDTAKAQLKGLGYEAKDVERITGQVTTAIDGGMTTMAEGTAVAAGALAAGVKEGKELEKYIKLVGDAAVGANRPVGEMAQIFNRVQGQGKLMTQELNMIEQSLPGFAQAMADEVADGSLEAFRKMVTNGKVGSKDFLKVMDGFAGDMASAYSQSWEGMVKNTLAYVGIIGENLLRGVFQKSKEEIADFIEVLKSDEVVEWAEKAGVAIGNSFRDILDKVKSVKESYDQLTPAQQEFVNKVLLIAPAVAVGIGPALTLFSKLTAGVSGTLKVASKLTKAIGVARGAGLAAGLSSLGPLAVGGIAVAGIVGVGVAIKNLMDDSEELQEVNLDVAESLSNEAIELENAANTFDKLSEKAKISNDELAELNDLNKRISESSNPGEIDELQKRYNDLAKNSGLTKDELNKLFKANDSIIEQSDDVEKSVSDQGNAFAKNTDAVHEYVNSLYELSIVEIQDELKKAEDNKVDLLKEQTRLMIEQDRLAETRRKLYEIDAMSEKERHQALLDWTKEIKEEQLDSETSTRRRKELEEQLAIIGEYQKDGMSEALTLIQEQRSKLEEKLKLTDEDLAKMEALNNEAAELVLKQVGINEEGEKGLAQLDESIAKNQEELNELDKKLEKNGSLTEKEQERYDQLYDTTEKQREARDYLHDELGVYKDLNSLAQAKLEKVDKETEKEIKNLAKKRDIKVEEGNILQQLRDKNTEHDKEIEKIQEEGRQQGLSKKEIEKQVKELENKKGKNNEVIQQILEELDIWDDLDEEIKKGIKSEQEKGGAVEDTKRKLDIQGSVIEGNNRLTDIGIGKEQERTREAGKDASKKVTASDHGTIANINRRATTPKSKKVKLFQTGLAAINRMASNPVTKTITFVGKGLSKLKFWEKGTPPSGHPGGPAVIGEKGSELVRLRSGESFLSPNTHTLLNLPKGAHVTPHRETKRIMKSAPKYADGTKNWAESLQNSELARLLAINNKSGSSEIVFRNERTQNNNGPIKELLKATLQQNEILMQILTKNPNIVMHDRIIGELIEPIITEIQNRNTKISNEFSRR